MYREPIFSDLGSFPHVRNPTDRYKFLAGSLEATTRSVISSSPFIFLARFTASARSAFPTPFPRHSGRQYIPQITPLCLFFMPFSLWKPTMPTNFPASSKAPRTKASGEGFNFSAVFSMERFAASS